MVWAWLYRDERLLRDYRTWEGKVPDVGEGKGFEQRGMARGMRASDTATGKHRRNRAHSPAPQFPWCRWIPWHRQYPFVHLRSLWQAKKSMVNNIPFFNQPSDAQSASDRLSQMFHRNFFNIYIDKIRFFTVWIKV